MKFDNCYRVVKMTVGQLEGSFTILSLSLTHDVPSILDYLSSRVLRRFRLTITSAHLTLNVNDDKNQLVR